jgi:hypothetical protein
MNGFIKTLSIGLSALFVIALSAVVTGLVIMKQRGEFEPSVLRDLVLSAEEKLYLVNMNKRPIESPIIARQTVIGQDEILEQIAEMANADRASQLVAQLRRQKQALDERQALLDQQWAEFQLGKADILRLQRQLEAKKAEIQILKDSQQKEHDLWAKAQLAEIEATTAIESEKVPRYQEQARLFEQMKDNAWLDLRRMDVKEIARYLSYMDPRKAGRLLIIAQKDTEYPDIAVSIHKAMVQLDKDSKSADQISRLVRLYSFMTADAVIPYLRDSTTQEIADILIEMERLGMEKKRAELLEALRKDNSKRELEVERLMLEAKPSAAVGQ